MTLKSISKRGNAYIEYFVIASAVMLAALVFYNQGNFRGARANVEQVFDSMAGRIVGP